MPLVARVAAFLFVAGALLALPSGQAAAQLQVAVSLNDSPFEVTASPSSVAAGAVDFQVSNVSTLIPHNLRVIRTDLAPDALPMSDLQVDESQVTVVASTSEDIAEGATATVSANLEAGSYVLICNIETHYDAGMRTAFTVTAALPTDTPTDGEPTDGGTTGPAPTPPSEVTQLAQTGAGTVAGSSGGWWVPAMLAGAGVALFGLGVATYRRLRVER